MPVAIAHQLGLAWLARHRHLGLEGKAALMGAQQGTALGIHHQGLTRWGEPPEPHPALAGQPEADLEARGLAARAKGPQLPDAAAGIAPQVRLHSLEIQVEHQTPQPPAGQRVDAHHG